MQHFYFFQCNTGATKMKSKVTCLKSVFFFSFLLLFQTQQQVYSITPLLMSFLAVSFSYVLPLLSHCCQCLSSCIKSRRKILRNRAGIGGEKYRWVRRSEKVLKSKADYRALLFLGAILLHKRHLCYYMGFMWNLFE